MHIIGNKCDLHDQRAVTKKEAQSYDESINASYFETSAKDDTGIFLDFHTK